MTDERLAELEAWNTTRRCDTASGECASDDEVVAELLAEVKALRPYIESVGVVAENEWWTPNWTQNSEGRENSSAEFTRLCAAVEGLIGESYHAGNPRALASLILAQLAHVHGLVPTPSADTAGPAGATRATITGEAKGDLP